MRNTVAAVACVAGCAYSAWACEPARDASRIAVAGGSLTEIIYLLGAEDRIVAVDSTSNYPEAAAELPSVGYVRNLSAEGLLSLSPTLILGEDDMGPPAVLEQLEQANVQTVRVEEQHDAAGIIRKVRCVAEALGLIDEAADRLDELEALAAELAPYGRVVDASSPAVAMLLSLRDGAPLAAGDNTSGGGFLRMAGARNVFSSIDGWKPVNTEAFAAANPDVIVIPERGAKALGGKTAVAAHPSLRLTTAARDDGIVVMDGMAMLGFGPRTLQAALDFARRLHDGANTE